MEEFTRVETCLLFLMLFNDSGRGVVPPNATLMYFHWFYIDFAIGTTRSYDVPANNAKYSHSNMCMIPCVFSIDMLFSDQRDV